MHILHVIDWSSSESLGTTLALIADLMREFERGEDDHRLCVLGSDEMIDRCNKIGLVGFDCLRVGLGDAMLGWPMFRRYLKKLRGEWGVDVIHAWSLGCAALAKMTARELTCVCTVTQMPHVSWKNMVVKYVVGKRPVSIVATNQTIGKALFLSGLAASDIGVVRPGLDNSRLKNGLRSDLRRSWGVDDSTNVVFLAGDPVCRIDVMFACCVITALCATGHDMKLMVSQGGLDVEREMSSVEQLGVKEMIILDERVDRPWEILAGCDIVLAIDTRSENSGNGHSKRNTGAGGGLSLLWAMAAGIPIIGEAVEGIEELVRDKKTGLLGRAGHAMELARLMKDVLDKKDYGKELGLSARTEVYQRYAVRYCADDIKSVYNRAISRMISGE